MVCLGLRKLIIGIVNNVVNVGNIQHVVSELFSENLVEGRGLCAQHHEGSGLRRQAYPLHPVLRLWSRSSIQNYLLVLYGRRVVTSPIGQPIPKGIQEK